MNDTALELVTNIAHLKCIVKDNEIHVDLYKATKSTNELVERIARNNNSMREILVDITKQIHILFDDVL